ncbi:MAG: YecA family protein, partial [Moorellaceae bacterium]
MRLYHVERNDACPCGSGRKYKKCCLGKVEETTRILKQAVGHTYPPGMGGKDLLPTLGYLYGVQWSDKPLPADLDRLGRLLRAAWEEQEQAEETGESAFFITAAQKFEDLLEKKESLRYLYVPAASFLKADLALGSDTAENAEEDTQHFLQKVLDIIDEDFLAHAVEWVAFALALDEWSEDEAKTLLTVLTWALNDNTRRLFLIPILERTVKGLAQGTNELEQSLNQADKTADESLDNKPPNDTLQEIMTKYPMLADLTCLEVWPEARVALQALVTGKLPVDIPLYALLGGVYSSLAIGVGNFTGAAAAFPRPEEIFWKQGECFYFLPSLMENLKRHLAQGLEEKL